jgi:transglutaminase-like putative cysteine protease
MTGDRTHPAAALALGALLVACGGAIWYRVFPVPALLPIVAVGALGSAALVALWSGALRRRGATRPLSLWLAVPAGIATWLVVVAVTLARSGPAAAAPAWTIRAVRDGWYELLLAPPPVPAEPRLLVGLHALLWFAGYATAELIVRTRAALLPVLPGCVVLLGGVAFGVGGAGSTLPALGAFVFLALALVLVRHTTARGRRRLARVFSVGLPWIAVVACLAAALGAASPGLSRTPYDPRRLVQPASVPQTASNPLDQVSAWLNAPDTRLFTVRATEQANWRIAALDRFDGHTWRTDDQFRVIHTRVPPVTNGAPVRPLKQTVTVAALAGPWLPAATSPVEIAGIPVVADPGSGVLLSRIPVRAGLTYRVTSSVPQLTVDLVRRAVAEPSTPADLELPPGLPPRVRDAAEHAVAGATSPFEQASRLERYLRRRAINDPTAPPGHSYGHLAYFLASSHRGTSEQFATAFAVMARSFGLPCRVVVGFRPGTPISTGVWEVRGADAFVWPEVRLAGLGWVPFYPTPGATAAAGDTSLADGQSRQRRELERELAAPPAEQQAASTRSTTGGATTQDRHRQPGWLLGSAGAALLGACYLGVVLLAPAVRARRRRRTPDPAARVIAAWRETLVVLRWVGVTDVCALTTAEVSAKATSRLGPPASADLAALAALADEAAFSGRPLGGGCAEAAWTHRDRLAALVRRAVGRRASLRRSLSPLALRG